LPGVVLHDVDALEAIAQEGESLRVAEVERAEAMVAAQAEEFRAGRAGAWPVAA
jgi:glutamyl-tRNA reductase